MSSQRYDVMAGRPYTDRNGDQKTAWTRIGTMWPMKDRDGFSITFEALPVPALSKDGKIEVRVTCFPPKEKEDGGQQRGGGARTADLDDEIPWK